MEKGEGVDNLAGLDPDQLEALAEKHDAEADELVTEVQRHREVAQLCRELALALTGQSSGRSRKRRFGNLKPEELQTATYADIAVSILSDYGAPMTTRRLLSEFTAVNRPIGGKYPGTTLYVTLKRDPRVERRDDNTWALV